MKRKIPKRVMKNSFWETQETQETQEEDWIRRKGANEEGGEAGCRRGGRW